MERTMLDLDPKTTALVLIDLQKGIVGREIAPRSGAEVCATGIALAKEFRAAGAPVVLVNVDFSADGGDMLKQRVDQPMASPPGGWPAGWSELVDGLQEPGDILVTKHQWGAFHGTGLDLQFRRRGITTFALGGVATNFGVESTARQGWELGYEIALVEDACATMSPELHDMAIRFILPRLSRITKAGDLAFSAS
jgi:nicotinamidase-related amidase